MFQGKKIVHIQLVRVILTVANDPEGALYWGTSHNKNALGMQHLQTWLDTIDERNQNDFVNRFQEDAEKLDALLEAHEVLVR